VLSRSIALLLPAWLLAAAPAGEGGFFVSPVQVILATRGMSKGSTGVVTLRNQTHETARFQLSVWAWAQANGGAPQLTPTQDVVFSPPLLILAPKEERKIRLAPQISCGPVESTYRLLIEELRPPRKEGDFPSPVQMLTTMSLPVFLPPPRPVVSGRIESLAMRSHQWTFQLKNTGNVHLQVSEFSIRGLGPSGGPVLQRNVPGGYVLAGTAGLFHVEFTREECASLRSLLVDLKPPVVAGSQAFDVPPNACQ